jgi:(+)-trans-carveol dehydrogenase
MRVEGKVAFVTGVARGQGRSHAVRLAEEGADIIGIDICAPIATVTGYPMATPDDLAEAGRRVTALGRRMVARQADVRDLGGLASVVSSGAAELGGGVDIVVANAGIVVLSGLAEMTAEIWQETIDINLTGVWNTIKAALPHLRDGGSIIIIGSTTAQHGAANLGHYVAAKTGLVGLMRTVANELGHRGIRSNILHPTGVDTTPNQNEGMYRRFMPELEAPTREDYADRFRPLHILPVPWVEPRDVSNAVLFLASDESRYITGVEIPVDAGYLTK